MGSWVASLSSFPGGASTPDQLCSASVGNKKAKWDNCFKWKVIPSGLLKWILKKAHWHCLCSFWVYNCGDRRSLCLGEITFFCVVKTVSEVSRRHLVITQAHAGPAPLLWTQPAFLLCAESLPNQKKNSLLSLSRSPQYDWICSVGLWSQMNCAFSFLLQHREGREKEKVRMYVEGTSQGFLC